MALGLPCPHCGDYIFIDAFIYARSSEERLEVEEISQESLERQRVVHQVNSKKEFESLAHPKELGQHSLPRE